MTGLALAFWLSATAVAQQSGPPQVLQLPKQNGGVATFYSGNRIGQQQSPLILNGYLDADAAVVKRNGYQSYGTITGCTSPVTGGWSYTSLTGTNYFFVVCKNQVYVTDGDGTFTAIGSTISVVYPVQAVATLGYEWFTDGADNLWYTNGVTTTSVTTAPYAKLIGTYQNRLILSNITGGPNGSGFTAAQSGSWVSGYQNGTDFALPAVIVDTSAAFFPLNGSNDTRQVTCVFDGFKNVQIRWNNGQMWGLYGTGNSSFVLQLISNEIGCIDQNTVQEYNGHLHWLSARGIEDFDGTTINLISWPIQDQVQSLIRLTANTQQNIQTSQADFQAGNLTASGPGAPLNATYYPGDVVPSSYSVTDSFSGGTPANSSTTAYGYLESTGVFYNSGFDDTGPTAGGPSGNFNNSGGVVTPTYAGWSQYCWVAEGNSNCSGNTFLNSNLVQPSSLAAGASCGSNGNGSFTWGGSYQVHATNLAGLANVYVTIADGTSFVDIATYTWSSTAGPCNTQSLAVPSGHATIRVAVKWATGASAPLPPYNGIISSAFTPGLLANQILYFGIGSDTGTVTFDLADPYYVASATFTSSCFDTGFSTPTWGLYSVTVSSPSSSTAKFYTAVATSCTGQFDAYVLDTPGVKIASAKKEAIKEQIVLTALSTQTATASPVTLSAETTGYWISQCIQPVSMTSWGAIQSDNIPNGGSFTYWLSTGTSCALVTNPATANWTAQTLNTTITVATSAYVGERVLEYVDVATEVPHLQDITLNYNSGTNRPASASTIYNKRYYLAYTTNSAVNAYNDHVLVFDTNNTWTLLDDIYASGLFTSALKLYSGSGKSDGNVFVQDTGNVDNGSAFTFTYQTPDMDFGSFANIKDLDDWWVEAQGTTIQASASNVSVNYFVDGGTTPYSAGTFSTFSPERGYLFPNGGFSLGGNPTKVHTLKLQYQDQSAAPLRIYQTNVRYWTESLP